MKSNIFIPKVINVGYRNRPDTYTGKLAYVIYYDEKNKLRKETSWNSWRDEKIPNEEFENAPTSGFVLNKKVGDYSSGWDHRKSYCRVYDPRNFEFEISIENLLYILENTNSIKGKGLDGEFVYGWDGKDLVLIPTNSPDYITISEYNDVIHSNIKIKAKDLVVGATYFARNNVEMVYMGKFNYYSTGYKWKENGEYKISMYNKDIPTKYNSYGYKIKVDYSFIKDVLQGKYFWFAYRNKGQHNWDFVQYNNISSKFIDCIDYKCTQEYSDIYERMTHEREFSPYVGDIRYFPYSLEDFQLYIKKDSCSSFYSKDGGKYKVFRDNDDLYYVRETYNSFNIENNGKSFKGEIDKIYELLKPCYIESYLENGYLYRKECYYGDKE